MPSFTIPCPACGTLNRTSAEREGQAGRCGRCHAPLAPLYLHPQSLDARSFEPFIRAYPGPILAEFWAPW